MKEKNLFEFDLATKQWATLGQVVNFPTGVGVDGMYFNQYDKYLYVLSLIHI